MRKVLVVVLIVVGVAALVVRFQARGSATVFRIGDAIVVRRSLVFVRPLRGGSVCRVATIGERLQLAASVRVFTRTRDEIELATRVAYAAPATVPRGWPRGDWCSSFAARVRESASRWASRVSADAVIADRRDAAHDAADAIARALASDGVRIAELKATLALPRGIERLRATPAASLARRVRPVIFIGLDGADWELLDGYIAAGAMPALARLVREGSGGVLETEHPPLSPLVWTTMFTGVGPLEHQILDFTRFHPKTHQREPITSDERRAPAIWNMTTAAGKSTAVFGVWATYAAEPVHGLNVSDRLFTFLFSESTIPADAVYPSFRDAWARRQLDTAERAVTAERMREYLPWLTDAENARAVHAANPYAEPSSALRRILVETEVYRRLAADYLRERSLPDLTILYLQGTDTIGHVFAPFAPPKQSAIDVAQYEKYSGVPARYFHEIDNLLADFVAIAERNGAIVMIASDHGFRWKDGRPTELSSFAAATAAKWHRNEGIFVVWGPGIAAKPGHPLRGGVRQTCATLAALTGTPLALGMATTPLPGITSQTQSIDYKPFFQRAATPLPTTSTKASSDDVAKLRSLGYLGSNEPSSAPTNVPDGDTKTAGAYNNAGLIQRAEHRIPEAVRSFEHALAIDPGYASAAWNLSETLFETEFAVRSSRFAGATANREPRTADSQRELDRADALLVQALQNGLADGSKIAIGRAIAYQRSGRVDRAAALLDRAIAAGHADAPMHLFRGRYRMDRNDCRGALEDFRVAAQLRPDAIAFASLGLAHMCLGDPAAARENFQRSLQLDPNQPLLQQYVAR